MSRVMSLEYSHKNNPSALLLKNTQPSLVRNTVAKAVYFSGNVE